MFYYTFVIHSFLFIHYTSSYFHHISPNIYFSQRPSFFTFLPTNLIHPIHFFSHFSLSYFSFTPTPTQIYSLSHPSSIYTYPSDTIILTTLLIALPTAPLSTSNTTLALVNILHTTSHTTLISRTHFTYYTLLQPQHLTYIHAHLDYHHIHPISNTSSVSPHYYLFLHNWLLTHVLNAHLWPLPMN